MWIGLLFINHSVIICGKEFFIGPRFSWVGFVYFFVLLFFAITGVWSSTSERNNLPETGKYAFRDWFALIIALRVVDILFSIYTGITRQTDPRRRSMTTVCFAASLIIISVVGGIAGTILGIKNLADYESPPSILFAISFYVNFVPLFFFYFLVLNPIGCCCVAFSLHFLQRRPIPIHQEQIPVHGQQNNINANIENAFVNNAALPDENNSFTQRVKITQENTWAFFSRLFAMEDADECALCVLKYEQSDILERLPCGHFFHSKCLSDLRIATNCPYCRQPIAMTTTDKHKIVVKQ